MNKKIQESFIFSAGVVLFMGAVFALFGAFSQVRIVDRPEPLLALFSTRTLFFIVAGVGLAASAFLLLDGNVQIKLTVIASLATQLLFYRLYLASIGAADLLGSLGNLTGMFPVHPRTSGWASGILLGWLLLGSYGLLAFEWFQQFKVWNQRRVKTGGLVPFPPQPAGPNPGVQA